MTTDGLCDRLRSHEEWRQGLAESIQRYRSWLLACGFAREDLLRELERMLDTVASDALTVAFLAEFSRGKTELINALFFADTGLRLLPSSPGRTTMCPTEIFADPNGDAYIRLIGIETRLSEKSLNVLKLEPEIWERIPLDPSSPMQMQEAFRSLAATKQVSRDTAVQLGLYAEDTECGFQGSPEDVEVPCWRHAMISFPHRLLSQGLVIVDTPGLNALGAEPELTLSLLPRAQAVIFVVAADSGVSKSDMDVWRCHVRGERQMRRKGLIVVLNKIDAVWDELRAESELDRMIQGQIEKTARTLDVDSCDVFPISAKQGLLAKIRGDDLLLKKSRLMMLERYLADGMVRMRQEILSENVVRALMRSLSEWSAVVNERELGLERQLNELRSMESQNDAFSRRLLGQAQAEQADYAVVVEALARDIRKFSARAQSLKEVIAPSRIQEIVDRTRKSMSESLTTIGMKGVMREVLDELRDALSQAAEIAQGAACLSSAIFSQFADDPAFREVKPAEFSLQSYQDELEEIFEQGEQFRTSGSSTSMYQSLVVNRLYGTLIARAQVLFQLAYDDSGVWSKTVFGPLLEHMRERRNAIESRLDMYRKVHERVETLDMEIESLNGSLTEVRAQIEELTAIQTTATAFAKAISQEVTDVGPMPEPGTAVG